MPDTARPLVNRHYVSPLPAPPSIRTIQIEIGRKIRTFRTMRGLTQQELGERINCVSQQVQKYETAAANVSSARLVHIATALGVNLSDFWKDDSAT